MGMHKIISVLLVMGLCVSFAGTVTAENDSLKVIMTIPNEEYRIGDTITATVYVFDAGTPVTPDNLTIEIGRQWGGQKDILNYTEKATGVYEAEYKVLNGDNHLYLYYDVKNGNDSEALSNSNEALRIDIVSNDFSVDLSFDGQEMITARPGDQINATVEIRFGTSLIDVDGFDELVIYDPNRNETDLDYTRISQGRYLVRYTLPGNITDSGMYTIAASPIGTGETGYVSVQVNVLDVWYKQISLVSNTATFVVGVANETGQGVSGASVKLMRGADIDANGTTNSTGQAILSLTGVHGDQYIGGYVTYGSLNQSISGSISNPSGETISNNAFDAIYTDLREVYYTGSNITRNYTAYDASAIWANKQVHYYVTSMEDSNINYAVNKVIKAGTVTTDATGSFSLTFTAPPDPSEVMITFEAAIPDSTGNNDDGFVYQEWPQYGDSGSEFSVIDPATYSDDSIQIGSDKLVIGGQTGIEVTLPSGANGSVFAYWNIGEIDEEEAILMNSPGEVTWEQWTSGGSVASLKKNTEGVYEGTITVPSFIDEDIVTLIVGYVDDSGVSHYNFVKITTSAGSSSDDGGDGSAALIGILILGAVALVLVGMLFFKKNGGPKKPEHKW